MTNPKVYLYHTSFKHLITHNETRSHKWIYSLVSIFFGFLVGFLIMLCVNPANAGAGFATLIAGGLPYKMQSVGNILFNSAPLIGVGLAVAVSSKAGIFNIGGSGQYTVGGATALIVANLINPYVPWSHNMPSRGNDCRCYLGFDSCFVEKSFQCQYCRLRHYDELYCRLFHRNYSQKRQLV